MIRAPRTDPRAVQRQVQQLSGGVLGLPQCSALDRSAEADRLH